MTPEELLKRIIEYGADEAEIQDRFSNNNELYAQCLNEFLNGPYFAELDKAIQMGEYELAFSSAHAIKGLSGNLGLNSFYKAICVLVESLRSKQYDDIDAQYSKVLYELSILKQTILDEPINDITHPAILEKHPTNSKKSAAQKQLRAIDKFFFVAAAAIIAVFSIATVIFNAIGHNYREKTKYESGQHLLETGKQIAMYAEEQITNDWKIADSIGKSILRSNYLDNDNTFLEILKEQQSVWNVSDLMLYTQDGYYINADGKIGTNDVGSATIANAYKNGRSVSIIDSTIIYTLPIDTQQTYGGSRIVALSVAHNMETLLDEMDLASYNNEAWIYLTDADGIVISMTTLNNAIFTFNVETLFEDMEISQLSTTDYSDDALSMPTAYASYMKDGFDEKYLVCVPLFTDNVDFIEMRLFYIVSASIVNSAMDDFSMQLLAYSVIIICFLVGLAYLAFWSIYRNRKKHFDTAISAREQMFDLLIQNISTVFGLFDTSKSKPIYISSNAIKVLGEDYWTIEKAERGYKARTSSGKDTSMLRQVNDLLREWDAKAFFRSGYLCDDSVVPPAYFELILYPVGKTEKEFVGIIQDVTSTQKREEATKSAMEMAKRSDKAKTRFLANMSHDIRTPMNAIMNMSLFALERANSPKKQEEYLRTIYESSRHLLYLINDVLDMSRIESGQTVIASEPFDLKAQLQKQVEALKPLCIAKKQTMIVDLDGIHVEAVYGDALKVSQIIINLLSNAIKFTPEKGAVRLTALQLPTLRDEMVSIRFTVEDNGIGISEGNKPHIFEPFARANDKRVGQIEGTGLGLSICKSYVEAMGGAITFQSEEGEGSIFTVELFFHKASIDKKQDINLHLNSNTPFNGMRCLVVEDIASNQEIARTILERIGFIVDIARDGGEGVQMFLQSKPNTYDVVYMDIQMPVFDGYKATDHIRHSDHPQAATIPIVAMSANVFAEDVERALIVGMDGYVGKPIVSLELIEQTIKALQLRNR